MGFFRDTYFFAETLVEPTTNIELSNKFGMKPRTSRIQVDASNSFKIYPHGRISLIYL